MPLFTLGYVQRMLCPCAYYLNLFFCWYFCSFGLLNDMYVRSALNYFLLLLFFRRCRWFQFTSVKQAKPFLVICARGVVIARTVANLFFSFTPQNTCNCIRNGCSVTYIARYLFSWVEHVSLIYIGSLKNAAENSTKKNNFNHSRYLAFKLQSNKFICWPTIFATMRKKMLFDLKLVLNNVFFSLKACHNKNAKPCS